MMSAPTGTITTVSTGWCTTRGHNMQSRWSKAAIFTTRWAAGWQNGNGGYGARPNKPPTPDPSKLPDIAKKLRLPYPIDQASSAPNVFKTFFRALSPYDYTLYCRKWVKPNLTCTPQDDSQYPGMDTKTASDYLPQTNWPTTQLPPGYTCAEPYLFPDINKPDGPATAGIDDLGEILAKMKQRTSRGIRK
ncbi:hypothetical protein ESCOCK365M_22170 [Escherichia coli]